MFMDNKPAIATIASGNSPQILMKSMEICSKSAGHAVHAHVWKLYYKKDPKNFHLKNVLASEHDRMNSFYKMQQLRHSMLLWLLDCLLHYQGKHVSHLEKISRHKLHQRQAGTTSIANIALRVKINSTLCIMKTTPTSRLAAMPICLATILNRS